MLLRVQFVPVPAMTGTRPAAASTAMRSSRSCSPAVSVGVRLAGGAGDHHILRCPRRPAIRRARRRRARRASVLRRRTASPGPSASPRTEPVRSGVGGIGGSARSRRDRDMRNLGIGQAAVRWGAVSLGVDDKATRIRERDAKRARGIRKSSGQGPGAPAGVLPARANTRPCSPTPPSQRPPWPRSPLLRLLGLAPPRQSPLWLVPGMASLALSAYLLTLVESEAPVAPTQPTAGSTSSAAILWLWGFEGHRR